MIIGGNWKFFQIFVYNWVPGTCHINDQDRWSSKVRNMMHLGAILDSNNLPSHGTAIVLYII